MTAPGARRPRPYRKITGLRDGGRGGCQNFGRASLSRTREDPPLRGKTTPG